LEVHRDCCLSTRLQYKGRGLVVEILFFIGCAALLIILPRGLSFLVGLFFGIGMAEYAQWAALRGRKGWIKVWPAALAVTVVAIALGGIAPRYLPSYRLHGSDVAHFGVVVPVSTDNGTITVVPCDKHDPIVVINSSVIAYIALIHTASAKPLSSPSLYQAWVEHQSHGAHNH